jgi:hypothetical protein
MGYNTATLIRRFVVSTAKLQSIGDILMVGLVNLPSFMTQYRTEDLFALAKSYGYARSEDTLFIQKCIQHGYRHPRTGDESDCDHDSYAAHHVTYVFER